MEFFERSWTGGSDRKSASHWTEAASGFEPPHLHLDALAADLSVKERRSSSHETPRLPCGRERSAQELSYLSTKISRRQESRPRSRSPRNVIDKNSFGYRKNQMMPIAGAEPNT
jgi:hypothetical protein